MLHQYTYIKATLCIIGKTKLNQSLQPKQRKFLQKTLGLLIAIPFILKTGVKIWIIIRIIIKRTKYKDQIFMNVWITLWLHPLFLLIISYSNIIKCLEIFQYCKFGIFIMSWILEMIIAWSIICSPYFRVLNIWLLFLKFILHSDVPISWELRQNSIKQMTQLLLLVTKCIRA